MSAPEKAAADSWQRVAGLVAKVRFQNPETGWFAIDLARKGEPPLSVVGVSATTLEINFSVACCGPVVMGKWGLQLQAAEVEVSPPKTSAGIRKYLSSGMFAGIGTRTADRIVDELGEHTLAVLDNAPDRIFKIKGINKKKGDALIKAWQAESAMREITVFALSQGITMSQIRKIMKAYGNEAARLIKEDPYRLCRDIHGIGFRIADAIARKLGVAFDSPFRIRASLRYCLESAAQEGHCGLSVAVLTRRCAELLTDTGSATKPVIAGVISWQAVNLEIRPQVESGQLIADRFADTWYVYLPHLYQAEKLIAGHFKRLINGPVKGGVLQASIDMEIARACDAFDIELAPEQHEAIRTAMASKVCVITGGPGVGKTTIMKVLLHIFKSYKWSVGLCALAGKAAERLTETSGQEGFTIHRLLGYKNGAFTHNETNELEFDALFADEFSMPDVLITQALVRALPNHTRLVIIGDVDQLPSVGAGAVLNDLINSGVIPVVRLTRIFRQGAGSDIVRIAHMINSGVVPTFKQQDTDCLFIECDESQDIPDVIARLCESTQASGFLAHDIQVLTPMSSTVCGTQALNIRLGEVLNTHQQTSRDVDGKFRFGDRVMQTRNDYEKGIFNGNIGYVVAEAGRSNDSNNALTVQYKTVVEYASDDLEALRLAWGITIHKSQGSEFPVVIIPMTTSHYVMLKRNLIYTALTRAKKLAIFIGSKRALEIAVRNIDDSNRHTMLGAWLRGHIPTPLSARSI